MRLARRLGLLATAFAVACAGLIGSVPAYAAAGPDHTVTLVNMSGQKIWIGAVANKHDPDGGSVDLTGLPILAPGASATVKIPENQAPGHWRGRFFARTGCTGRSGSTFHCVVGDCGPYAHQCSTGEQPVSLAEFTFDTADANARGTT